MGLTIFLIDGVTKYSKNLRVAILENIFFLKNQNLSLRIIKMINLYSNYGQSPVA